MVGASSPHPISLGDRLWIINTQEPAGSRDLVPTSDDVCYETAATTPGDFTAKPPNQSDPNYGYYSPHDPINLGAQNNYAEGGGLNSDWINVLTGMAPVLGDPNSVYVADQQGPLDGQSIHGTFDEDDPQLSGIIWKVNLTTGAETPIIVGGSDFTRTQDLKVDQYGNIVVLGFSDFIHHDAPTLAIYHPSTDLSGNTTYTQVGLDPLGSSYNGLDVLAVSASPQTGNDVFYVGE